MPNNCNNMLIIYQIKKIILEVTNFFIQQYAGLVLSMNTRVPASTELCDSNVFDSQILMILQHMYFDNSLAICILSFNLLTLGPIFRNYFVLLF